MRNLPVVSIEEHPTRQRKTFTPADLKSLMESIEAKGLFHPVTIAEVDGKYRLIAGGRRLRAITALHEAKTAFRYDGEIVPDGLIPTALFASTSPLDQAEAELDENIIRADLTWQEKQSAILLIHELKKAQSADPDHYSHQDTGRALAAGGGVASGPKTPTWIARAITTAKVIADHMDDPSVANARTAKEAYDIALARGTQIARAALARQALRFSTTTDLRNVDALTTLPTMDSAQFDVILTDPPYGIDADGASFSARTVHHHGYDDDFATARAILTSIVIEGFRLLKNRGILWIFTDYEHFDFLRSLSSQTGFVPFRTPLIWQKSLSEGIRPSGWGRGVARSYDTLFLARKGQRGLLEPITDVLFSKRVSRSERQFAAEKPVEFMSELIRASSLPGERILDPCAGSGSTLVAARQLKRSATGLEIDPIAYQIALARISEETSEVDPEKGAEAPKAEGLF